MFKIIGSFAAGAIIASVVFGSVGIKVYKGYLEPEGSDMNDPDWILDKNGDFLKKVFLDDIEKEQIRVNIRKNSTSKNQEQIGISPYELFIPEYEYKKVNKKYEPQIGINGVWYEPHFEKGESNGYIQAKVGGVKIPVGTFFFSRKSCEKAVLSMKNQNDLTENPIKYEQSNCYLSSFWGF